MKKSLYYLLFTFWFISFAAANNLFYWKVQTRDKIVFLTFDDGPGDYTVEVLDILKKYNIKATFFVLGELVRIRPNLIKKIVDEGHSIGNHTYSHLNFYQLQKKYSLQKCKQILLDELKRTEYEIKLVLGDEFKVKFLRMPNGFYKTWMDDIVAQFGYKVINWTFGYDWHNVSEEELFIKYKNAVSPGTIFLFHDGGKNRQKTITVLKRLIDYCLSEGYKFGVLSEWIK